MGIWFVPIELDALAGVPVGEVFEVTFGLEEGEASTAAMTELLLLVKIEETLEAATTDAGVVVTMGEALEDTTTDVHDGIMAGTGAASQALGVTMTEETRGLLEAPTPKTLVFVPREEAVTKEVAVATRLGGLKDVPRRK